MQKTDYGKIANTYNKRYESNYLPNIEIEIKKIVSERSDVKNLIKKMVSQMS